MLKYAVSPFFGVSLGSDNFVRSSFDSSSFYPMSFDPLAYDPRLFDLMMSVNLLTSLLICKLRLHALSVYKKHYQFCPTLNDKNNKIIYLLVNIHTF